MNTRYWEEEIETMSREELKELQLQRLRKTISIAANAPYYKEVFAKHGITADSIRSLEDIRQIPFTTKADMRAHYPFGLVAGDMKNDGVRIHSSSGTTGNPTVIVHSQHDLDSWANLVARCLYMVGIRKTDVFQSSSGYGMFTGGLGFQYGADRLGALTVPAAAGTTFDRNITTNVGNVDSQGVEFSLNATPIQTKDWNWDLSFNMTWQKMKVKNLSLTAGTPATNTSVGPYIDSYQVQTLSEGYAPYMFYVYHQLYDEKTGKPIEGAYVDLDGDGQINSNDLYRYHSPAPDYILGFSTSLRYKKWTLSTSLRANIGNYVYNAMAMNSGAWETVSYNSYQLNNLSSTYLKTGFQTRQYLSDYYVENASFLKMDNLSLGYNFGTIYKGCSLNVSAMVQNVFCITKYSGVDPEIPDGVDNSFYPRPRTFSLNIGINF